MCAATEDEKRALLLERLAQRSLRPDGFDRAALAEARNDWREVVRRHWSHYSLADGRWERHDPDGTVTPMPSGWRPGKHPPDVKP
jgi:hypothetical protein